MPTRNISPFFHLSTVLSFSESQPCSFSIFYTDPGYGNSNNSNKDDDDDDNDDINRMFLLAFAI